MIELTTGSGQEAGSSHPCSSMKEVQSGVEYVCLCPLVLPALAIGEVGCPLLEAAKKRATRLRRPRSGHPSFLLAQQIVARPACSPTRVLQALARYPCSPNSSRVIHARPT